jgi:hypothetical protein
MQPKSHMNQPNQFLICWNFFGVTVSAGAYWNAKFIKHVMVTRPYQIDQNHTVHWLLFGGALGKPTLWGQSDSFFGSGSSRLICGLPIASRLGLPLCLACPVAVNPQPHPIGGCSRLLRGPLLHICYDGSIGHVSEGMHEYLHAFWKPVSHTKRKYIPLILAAGSTPKKRSNVLYSVPQIMYVHI